MKLKPTETYLLRQWVTKLKSGNYRLSSLLSPIQKEGGKTGQPSMSVELDSIQIIANPFSWKSVKQTIETIYLSVQATVLAHAIYSNSKRNNYKRNEYTFTSVWSNQIHRLKMKGQGN